MVAWTFRKAPGFFDIQTWTGDDSDSRQIPHNLDSTWNDTGKMYLTIAAHHGMFIIEGQPGAISI